MEEKYNYNTELLGNLYFALSFEYSKCKLIRSNLQTEKYIRLGVELENKRCILHFARLYVKDSYEKIKYYKKAIHKNGLAEHGISRMYYKLNDYQKMFRYAIKAYDKNYNDANELLCLIYRNGLYVKKNEQKALEYEFKQ